MPDARYVKSERAIKDALLGLLGKKQLASVTMAELADEAQVSRSTLYAHFSNVDDVYIELTRDFSASLRPLGTHLRCDECSSGGEAARPFCIALRDAGRYLPLVRDARFLPTLFDQIDSAPFEEGMSASYGTLGLGEAQAKAVFRFQMTGCYTVALSEADRSEWADIQQALDTFIRGGINALRAG